MELELIYVGWLSILPPLVAIVLALMTKEVYSSLVVGILSGMLIYCVATSTPIFMSLSYIFDMMAYKISENAYMIIFLALLGALVYLISQSGGSQAYGKWASKKLKTKTSASLATFLLGILIFIDDYFNCLTIGTVMKPITDKFCISREKLAYIIDATAAPVCIIAPISSWAVAVSGELGGGMSSFMKVIPYNLYALLTLTMVIFMCVIDFDFGPMKDTNLTLEIPNPNHYNTLETKGNMLDLILPMACLIISSVTFMAAVGGFFEGVPFGESIGVHPTLGLSLGAFVTLIFTMILYIPRKLLSYKDCIEGIIEGMKSMLGATLILIFAWSLSGVCRELIGTGEFVSTLFANSSFIFELLPFIVFLISAFLSFSMGTAWGTFSILIPIITMICSQANNADILFITLGATLAGSVYGDHCSPISDTTILSSAGAQCDHINHVRTQLPYATFVAVICAIGFIIGGFIKNAWITLAICEALLLISLIIIKKISNKSIF